MIVLDSINKKIELVLGGAVTTNELPFTVSYADYDGSAFTPASNDSASNGGTEVDVVTAPGASIQRLVSSITIHNEDTVSATVTVKLDNNGTDRTLFEAALESGDQAIYNTGYGWLVLDDSGNTKAVSGAPDDAQYWTAAIDGDLSSEVVVNDEASLYTALSDVSDFVQPGDAAHDGFSDFVANEHVDHTAGAEITLGGITIQEKSSDPSNPSEGEAVIWMSDGTASGDDGDIMAKVTAGGVTVTETIKNFSANIKDGVGWNQSTDAWSDL